MCSIRAFRHHLQYICVIYILTSGCQTRANGTARRVRGFWRVVPVVVSFLTSWCQRRNRTAWQESTGHKCSVISRALSMFKYTLGVQVLVQYSPVFCRTFIVNDFHSSYMRSKRNQKNTNTVHKASSVIANRIEGAMYDKDNNYK